MVNKTENCSRKLICRFTEKNSMRLFLEMDKELRKNIDFGRIQIMSLT
jgi:hypothetical protein